MTEGEPAAPAATGASRRKFLSMMVSIMLPMGLAAMDQTIIAAAIPEIAAEMHNFDQVSWLIAGYLVAACISAPVYGRLGDLYGRRRLMIVAVSFYLIGAFLCAISTNLGMLIATRILQGLGGGGLLTLSHAIIGQTVPPRDRAKYQGYLAAVVVTASSTGPILGGFLTQAFGWQSIFWFNLPAGTIAVLLLLRLPEQVGLRETAPFDALGLVFLATFIAPVLVSLEFIREANYGLLPVVAALLVIAAIASILLVRHERRVPAPLLPVALLRQPTMWRACLLVACHGAMLISMVAIMPIYYRAVHGTSPGEAGLYMLPMTLGLGFGSMLTGQLISRTGRTLVFASAALPLATATLVALALGLSPIGGPLGASALSACFALLIGSVMPAAQVTVQSAAGLERLGAGSAAVQLSRALGGALGTTLVSMGLVWSIAASGNPSVATAIERGRDTLVATAPAARQVLDWQIRGAFQASFLIVATTALLASLLAWWIPSRRL
jgi:EmrB/QacA subfamily drug resistance transporter